MQVNLQRRIRELFYPKQSYPAREAISRFLFELEEREFVKKKMKMDKISCEKCGEHLMEAHFYDEKRGKRSIKFCPKGCDSRQNEMKRLKKKRLICRKS